MLTGLRGCTVCGAGGTADPRLGREARLLSLDLYGTLGEKTTQLTPEQLKHMYREVRERTERVLGGLTEQQLFGLCEPTLNPMVWVVGHCAHFYENMVLRLLVERLQLHGPGTLLAGWDVDGAFDSFRADHDDRWAEGALAEVAADRATSYPSCAQMLAGYRDRVTALLMADIDAAYPVTAAAADHQVSAAETYLHTYGVIHEHWHIEDWIQTRQTMHYPAPVHTPTPVMEGSSAGTVVADAWGGVFPCPGAPLPDAYGSAGNTAAGPFPGEVRVPGCVYMLGASRDQPWVFDAERFEHPVTVAPFAISKAAVTNAEFALFIDVGGYQTRKYWCHEGWRWLTRKQPVLNVGQHETDGDKASSRPPRVAPRYWHRSERGDDAEAGGPAVLQGWRTVKFDDEDAPIYAHHPVVHVSWFEAWAYCRWKGCRLPTEAEWEVAARCELDSHGDIKVGVRRSYSWGSEPPTPGRCNIDGYRGGLLDVASLPAGDSALGCRQMIGQVWEWTSTAFYPYPGFLPDFPYRENSCPWFGYRKVVKGGCWGTSAPIARAGYRHSFWPNMDAVYTGFRTARSLEV